MLQGLNFKFLTPLVFNKLMKKSNELSYKDNFLFSISYLINIFLQVSFYGSILVNISTFFIPFVVLLFAIDYLFIIRSDKSDRSLPFTIFSNTVIILICGVFPVSYISLQSMASSFEEVFRQQVTTKGLIERVVNYFFFLGNKFVGFFIKLKPVSWTMLDLIFIRIQNGIQFLFVQLITDFRFLFAVTIYGVLIVLYWRLDNQESFQERLQSKIWKRQEKLDSLVFKGQSYKGANPAYQLLGQTSPNEPSAKTDN